MVNEQTSIPLPRTRVVHFSCWISEQMHWHAQKKWFGCVFIKVCSIVRAIHSNSRDICHFKSSSASPSILSACTSRLAVWSSSTCRTAVYSFFFLWFFLFYLLVFPSILLHCGWGKAWWTIVMARRKE